MSADLAPERSIAGASADTAQAASTMLHGTALCLTTLLAVCMIEHATLSSMVTLWLRSQTFAHGFLIAPISVMLVWRQRRQLQHLPHRASPSGLLLLAALASAWLLASVADVQVITQYCVVAMIAAIVLCMMGRQVTWALAFPLAYLLLAVPFGEILIPALIDFTSRFTVVALQMTGVPVFQENNFLSIPSGNWSVVDACSGLRYVISSVALGTLYAYLNFHSLLRRLVFIAVALVLPVFANGVRAYLIVMLGHWSDMRMAVGVDHLIYGWLFFGLVSLLLFWLASFWRDQPKLSAGRPGKLSSKLASARMAMIPASSAAPAKPATPTSRMAAPVTALACLVITGSSVWLAEALNETVAPQPLAATPMSIQAKAPWTATAPAMLLWQAPHAGKPLLFMQNYQNKHGAVGLQLVWYGQQSKGAQLLTVAEENADAQCQLLERSVRSISAAPSDSRKVTSRTFNINQSILRCASGRLLVWRWYRQSEVDTGSAMLVKFLLAKSKILRQREDGAEIIISAGFEEGEAPPAALLQAFTTSMLPAIDKELNDVANRNVRNR